MDGFHEAIEIQFIILGVCIFLVRVSKAFIKSTRKSSEMFIYLGRTARGMLVP